VPEHSRFLRATAVLCFCSSGVVLWSTFLPWTDISFGNGPGQSFSEDLYQSYGTAPFWNTPASLLVVVGASLLAIAGVSILVSSKRKSFTYLAATSSLAGLGLLSLTYLNIRLPRILPPVTGPIPWVSRGYGAYVVLLGIGLGLVALTLNVSSGRHRERGTPKRVSTGERQLVPQEH